MMMKATDLFFTDAFEEMIIKHIVQTVDSMQLIEYLTKKMLSTKYYFSRLEHASKKWLECLKEIRNNEKFKEILIAIYSTSGAEKKRYS
jgi:hypothetical protein